MRLAPTQEFDAPDATYQCFGVLICSMFSALFWTSLFAVAGACRDQLCSAPLLLTVGAAITAFLCASLPLILTAR